MRKLILTALFLSSAAVHAQQTTQGADKEGGALDPASKARVRTEGAAGGTPGGLKTEAQKDPAGNASVGQGRTNRSRAGVEKRGGGREHDETSSDREQARGARGSIR